MTSFICCSKNSVFYSPNQTKLIEIDFSGQKISEVDYDSPICAIDVDPINQYLAVGIKKEGSSGKENLFIYKLNDDGTKSELFPFILPHEAIQLKFVEYKSKYSLIALNTGDLDCIDIENKKSQCLLGSIATGTAFDLSEKFIINADRDARIRISNYPNTYDIHAFAFLHEEFVSSVLFLNNEIFLSSDGDGNLVKWDINGQIIISKQIYPSNTIIRKIVFYNGKIGIIAEGDNSITMLNEETFEIEEKISLKSQPISLTVHENAIWGITLTEVFKFENGEVTEITSELFGEGLKLEDFTLENQRVKSKKILKNSDKGSEEYKRWRNPEKLSLSSK
ncbi:tRNA (guanine-N(7)-)-methyltransferase non-catalytic subunit wuho [Histomonas meleagridis]|uniref:tRNA (guanine-N(7)-)-methyltransferase non-catalytic subunit wuho n=1 Tax=Histomonas meleagridis TaxID=135588 RepID=UPI003559982E|nr:tRNA (guanine-N(7)-)-methyltransferase non-catalytic subunit wuho [Histomonas meleagridis]KAH0796206.1 tRNA (guanine-N(7)-)-methyltransferase non-catalytic subunit wuho [Histomonas meleagridis]